MMEKDWQARKATAATAMVSTEVFGRPSSHSSVVCGMRSGKMAWATAKGGESFSDGDERGDFLPSCFQE